MSPQIHAICVGIDFYPDQWKSARYFLSGCVNDAQTFASYLKDYHKVPDGNIKLLTSTPHKDIWYNKRLWRINSDYYYPIEAASDLATYANITKALLDVADSVKPGDQVLFTYSGHGGREWTFVPNFSTKTAGGKLTPTSRVPNPGIPGVIITPEDTTDLAGGPQIPGIDETLHTMDAYINPSKEGVYGGIRDFELSYLLNRIARIEGVRLTVVLDSCHSGGAFRDAKPPGEQGTGDGEDENAEEEPPVTDTPRTTFRELGEWDPNDSQAQIELQNRRGTYQQNLPLGIPMDDLQDSWEKMIKRTTQIPSNTFLVKPLDYEIFTGCLQHELSWESVIDQKSKLKSGRLSRALINTLQFLHRRDQTGIPLGTILRNVHDLVYRRNTITFNTYPYEKYILQTPVLLGDHTRTFLNSSAPITLGKNDETPPFGIPIQAVPYSAAKDSKRKSNEFPQLMLRAGEAHGVKCGDEYAVYLWYESLSRVPSPDRIRVVVTEVNTMTSVVRVNKTSDLSQLSTLFKEQGENPFGNDTVAGSWPTGCQAILISGPSTKEVVSKVGLKDVSSGSGANEVQFVPGAVPLWLIPDDQISREGEKMNYYIAQPEGPEKFQIQNASGNFLSRASSMNACLKRIQHMARYEALRGVETPKDLVAEMGKLTYFIFERVKDAESPTFRFGCSLKYREKESFQYINFVVFHFSSKYGVRQVYPVEGAFESVDAGRDVIFSREGLLAQVSGLPHDNSQGVDMLKAVMFQASSSFKMWEMPDLAPNGEFEVEAEGEVKILKRPVSTKPFEENELLPTVDFYLDDDFEVSTFSRFWVIDLPLN